MTKIKEIVDRADSVATANVNINGFVYGFREDFNAQRDPSKFPLLMFQKFIDGNNILEWKKGQGKEQRWRVVLFMAWKRKQDENIEEKQQEMQDYIEEFMESFIDRSQAYFVDGDVQISYFERFDNNNDVGVRYEFTLRTVECFGN